MDPFEWLSRAAPWLQPVILGLVVLFFVAGPIPRRAHDEIVGTDRDIELVASSSSEPFKQDWAKRRLDEIKNLQIPDFIFRLVDALVQPESEASSELRPRFIFSNSLARWLSLALLVVLGMSITPSRRAPKETEASPLVLLTGPAGDPTANRGRLHAWLARNCRLPRWFGSEPPDMTKVAALILVAIFLIVSAATLDLYHVPRRIPGRVLSGLACPSEFGEQGVMSPVAVLYSSFFATTPAEGTYISDANKASRASMIGERLNLPGVYFRGLARLTLWLFALLVSAHALGRRSDSGNAPRLLTILLLSGMLLHAFQWLYLVDAHGRLQLASETLRPLAARAFEQLAKADITAADISAARHGGAWIVWPFPVAYKTTEVSCEESSATLHWRGIWPLHRDLPEPDPKAGHPLKPESCKMIGGEREWIVDFTCKFPYQLTHDGQSVSKKLSAGPGSMETPSRPDPQKVVPRVEVGKGLSHV
jgi:hypothetical protein